MSLLARHQTLATPGYRTLILADADADADADDSALIQRSGENVVAGNGYQIYICSLQSSARAAVVVSVWDRLSHGDDDQPWDGAVDSQLYCETGLLLLREMTSDVPGQWQLPATGWYDVRVRWRNRELAAQRLSEIFERLDDITAIGIARARLDGLEEYHVDMALTEEQPQHLADD